MEDEERQTDEVGEEVEDSQHSPPQSNIIAGVVAFAVVVLIMGVAIYTGIAQTATALLMFPGIPLVLLWFVWRVFLRRLWRIRKIRNAQEKRELMEAALRGKSGTDPR
jgi:membrane protein implicated in regulation of membrane protease activity